MQQDAFPYNLSNIIVFKNLSNFSVDLNRFRQTRKLASFQKYRKLFLKSRAFRDGTIHLRRKRLTFRSLETSDKQFRLFDRRGVASAFFLFFKYVF
jgi:hypothetical protein